MKTSSNYSRFLGVIAMLLLYFNNGYLFAQNAPVPDPNFGIDGQVLTKIKASTDDISQSVAIQPDGKIVVAGNSVDIAGFSDMPVIRYKKNGVLDKSFNGTGKKIINNAFCNIVAIQADGKIVIGGSKAIGSSTVFGLWRLNADGTTDNSFGTDGAQTVAFGGYVICFAMTIQPDGKILIGGNDGNFYAGHASLALARLNANGQLDNTFNGDGKFTLNLTKKSLACQKILVQPDGKIIAAGQLDTIVDPYFRNEFFALRLHSDGVIDSSFGTNGFVRNKNSNSDNCYTAGLLADGRIVLGGFSQFTGYNAASVLCLHTDGAVDDNFGLKGWFYPNYFGSSSAIIYNLVIQGNGKIILAGNASYATTNTTAIALARLNGNGTLDANFGTGGMDTSFVSAYGAIGCNDVSLMPGGKIVVTGYKMLTYDSYMTARYLNGQQGMKVIAREQLPESTTLRIYPVPVTGDITLVFNMNSDDEVMISIYDLNGREAIVPVRMSAEKGTNTEQIHLPSSMMSGIYICKVTSESTVRSVEFQVKK